MYLGTYGKQKVAVKVLRNEGKPLTPEQKRGAESEVLIMRFLESPHVVFCHGFIPDLKEFTIVLELAPYGSLWDMVANHASFPALPFPLVISLLTDVADALNYLHQMNVTHKDLKCENVLVFHELRAKLGDFGLAKKSDGATTMVSIYISV